VVRDRRTLLGSRVAVAASMLGACVPAPIAVDVAEVPRRARGDRQAAAGAAHLARLDEVCPPLAKRLMDAAVAPSGGRTLHASYVGS